MADSLQNQHTGTRIRSLPIEERMRLYNEAWRLRKEFGYGYHLTGKMLGISKDVVRHWFHHKRNPYNEVFRTKFEEKPSPELSYIIGVMFGDGSLAGKYSKNHHDYKIRLRVNSKEFAYCFATKISKLLDTETYKIGKERDQYRVQIGNHQLYNLLSKPFEELKVFIEPFPTYFINGLVDREGSVTTVVCKNKKYVWLQTYIKISSNNKELLAFFQSTLSKHFNIKSYLKTSHKKGSTFFFKKKRLIRNADAYDLVIYGLDNIRLFSKTIGFNIPEKQEKLLNSIYIFESNISNSKKVQEWLKLYEKKNSKWVKKNESNINSN